MTGSTTVYGVRFNMCHLDSWLNTHPRKKDQICMDCKQSLKLIGQPVSFVQIPMQPNRHICYNCAQIHVNNGAVNFNEIIQQRKQIKQDLIEKIEQMISNTKSYYRQPVTHKKLIDCDIEQLQTVYEQCLRLYSREQDILQDIKDNFVDTPTEQYLVDQYEVYECSELQSHLQIIDHFKQTDSHDFFECGQGYSTDHVQKLVKIGKDFYNVNIHAEISSAKQDRGDRLYWVEKISNVTYQQIPKPLPLPTIHNVISLNDMTPKQWNDIQTFLKHNNIKWCFYN